MSTKQSQNIYIYDLKKTIVTQHSFVFNWVFDLMSSTLRLHRSKSLFYITTLLDLVYDILRFKCLCVNYRKKKKENSICFLNDGFVYMLASFLFLLAYPKIS